MKKIEVLSPAGSLESLKAGIHASCDAIYIGGNQFGARAYADNLKQDVLLEAIDYAHIHDKQIYLTVNTLLKDKELEEELYDFLYPYYRQGLDAAIVQDIGVIHFIHEHFPQLPLHASTQMTLTMAEGANVLKDFGVTRLVTSRELGLDEIKDIRSKTDLEIETFVHGALCYSYSGQCLMSSMFGGRSGNRGRCAQPCRMPYQLFGEKPAASKNTYKLSSDDQKYLLSPKDICTLDFIPDLIDAGINSLKIEGRMKRPEYTGITAYTYRKYVDKYLELGKEKYERYLYDHLDEFNLDKLHLMDIYNRGGFSGGYLHNRNGRSMITLDRPNHSGIRIGKVKEVKNGYIKIELEEGINKSDIIEIRGKEGTYEYTSGVSVKKGNITGTNYDRRKKLKVNDPVFRTRNNQLLDQIREQFITEDKKVLIQGKVEIIVGKKIQITLQKGSVKTRYLGEVVEPAKNQPMSEEKIRKQILKTNDTNFIFNELEIKITGEPFIPVKKLNEFRRNSLKELELAITKEYKREDVKLVKDTKEAIQTGIIADGDVNHYPGIHVSVATKEQLYTACEEKEVQGIYVESDIVPLSQLLEITRYIKKKGKKAYILLPYIFRKNTYVYFLRNSTILKDNTIDGYIIRNLEEYHFIYKELLKENKDDSSTIEKEIITDYNLYVMNKEASAAWKKLDVWKNTAPVELNKYELRHLRGIYYDMIVYGRIPLMNSAQCAMKTVSGGNNKHMIELVETKCCGADIMNLELVDRLDKKFPIRRHCRYCYTTIYNAAPLSLLKDRKEVLNLGVKNIRLNFTIENVEETRQVLNKFIQVYYYNKKDVDVIKDSTRGHFNRGIE